MMPESSLAADILCDIALIFVTLIVVTYIVYKCQPEDDIYIEDWFDRPENWIWKENVENDKTKRY